MAEGGWLPYAPPPAAESPLPFRARRLVFSPELRNFRDLLVALPPSYAESDRRFPVVYMQDGQNLFDPTTAYARDWHLGPILADLAQDGVEAIVVGIPNAGPHRLYEYSPFSDRRLGGGGGDRYLAFVRNTVKPSVDRAFRTRPGPADTVITGASMGGLISLYGLHRYPETFGAAGVMSPALWFADRAMLRLVETEGGLPGRIHLDIGLLEPAGAVADTRTLRDILLDGGLAPEARLEYVEDEAGAHAEEAWGRRFGRALPFLLGATR